MTPARETKRPTVALVIPTKDRPDELDRMLATIRAGTVHPTAVIVVDASAEPIDHVVGRYADLHARHVRHLPPSSAQQRNRGAGEAGPDVDLVAFMDDDILLEPDALERMLAFWATAAPSVAGASMNFVDSGHPGFGTLKRSRLARRLGLYSPRRGDVAPSGWQTAVGTVEEDVHVRWLPTTAVWWRRAVLDGHAFDDYFEGYSYLEDLDFSYGLSERHDLAVVAAARFHHAPAAGGRIGSLAFGRMEVENRLYVVRKHGLSLGRCLMGLAIRGGMTAGACLRYGSRRDLARLAGNVAGLLGPWGFTGTRARRHLARRRRSTGGSA